MFRQPCNVLVISWRYQTCQNDLVTGLICHQSCYKLLTACSKLVYNNWEQAVRTQLVDSLWTDSYTSCLQTCENRRVRFYVCMKMVRWILKLKRFHSVGHAASLEVSSWYRIISLIPTLVWQLHFTNYIFFLQISRVLYGGLSLP
jgi:hypothetical protein